jgi:hypothetical protein
MKNFIFQINNTKYNPMIACNSIVQQVKFESKYIPKSDKYIVLYKIEGLLDTFENEILI